ncbi:MAG: PatU [Calothrix sp. C42_A2020_038]|nr:PatU [Calothrix sp. C42_A2020_038]
MNSDSESLQNQLFRWLLATEAVASEDTSVECKENNGVEKHTNVAPPSQEFLQQGRLHPQTSQLGEIPTVQERFQAVLKRRLQIQIQNHPPLFPWETQIKEYPDYVDSPSVALVPAWGWSCEQTTLSLPISLPERVFRQLLEKCQALVTSSLPLGAKLVQAVESLFPNDDQAINDLAGLVLRTPYRSASTIEAMPNLGSDYFSLQTSQQMAVSLMAAKQLLDNLTLPVSVSNPVVNRQWLTDVGVINLHVEYLKYGAEAKLCVTVDLPTQGNIKVANDATSAMAQSSSAGSLSVEILCVSPRQPYTLEVKLTEIDQQPLTFLILPTV